MKSCYSRVRKFVMNVYEFVAHVNLAVYHSFRHLQTRFSTETICPVAQLP